MAAEDAIGGDATCGRQVEIPGFGVRDEPVRAQTAEHLAGRLRGHPQVPSDLGCRDAPDVIRPDKHAERQQIFLGGSGQVALVTSAGHDLRIRDRPAIRAHELGGRSRTPGPPPRR